MATSPRHAGAADEHDALQRWSMPAWRGLRDAFPSKET